MFRFETLDIWVQSRKYASLVYELTKTWPKSEQFGLISQIRRCSVSIAANIAEGSASRSKKEFRHFLDHSRKSPFETISHLYIACDQGYISNQQLKELYEESEHLIRRITAFQNSL